MIEKISKWIQVLLICYCARYCLRFAQLNFSGARLISARYLPYSLLVDDVELMLHNKENLKEITALVHMVDLNGDLKKEFIINKDPFGFYYNEIYSIDANGNYKEIASFYTRDALALCVPPLTLWGYPVIMANDGSWGYGLHKWNSSKKCYVHAKETGKK